MITELDLKMRIAYLEGCLMVSKEYQNEAREKELKFELDILNGLLNFTPRTRCKEDHRK